jgi:tetratricopeptide (TPR) repeat protein
MHVCGQGLLQADEGWNAGESDEIPFSDLPPGYYAVPVDEESEPMERCIGCGLVLNLARGLPRVDDPQELIPEDDDFDDLPPRDLEFVAGDLALHEKDFLSAEEHFRTTLDLDDRCLTEARQYLGLTLVWQGKLEEAIEHFELDVEDRGVRLSGFFVLWCILCNYKNPQAFVVDTKNYYTQLGWLDVEGKPTDDDWNEEEEEVLHTPLLPRDVLSMLKEYFEADSVEDIATPGDRLLSALVSYLRQDFRRVLALLYDNAEGAFGWAVAFWMVLACLELNREADAQKFLEQVKPNELLPPALLAPLRWTQTSHPTFYMTYVQPLFQSFHL